jgi:hypothetical protein
VAFDHHPRLLPRDSVGDAFPAKFFAIRECSALDYYNVDSSIAQFLMTRTKDLFDLGFAEPTLLQTRTAANVTMYLILLINRQAGDKAFVHVVEGEGVLSHRTFSVEFSTRFDSGRVFDTHNVKVLLPFPPSPLQVRTQVPMLDDLQTLYRLHLFTMHKHGDHGRKVLPDRGESHAYLAHYVFKLPYEEKVKRGWMYYDQGTDCYRPTFLGAYRITWCLMQPFKAVRQIALRRRAHKIMEEFDQAGGGVGLETRVNAPIGRDHPSTDDRIRIAWNVDIRPPGWFPTGRPPA